MRILILSILLLVCVQALFASSLQLQPESIGAHQPAKKVFYSKGKGVFGLITGLTLGPVGYAAICIFSHNRVTRKKALLGMEIWTAVALTVLIIYLILKNGSFSGSGKGSGGKNSGKSSPDFNLSNFDTPDPASHKHRRRQAMQAPPAIIMP